MNTKTHEQLLADVAAAQAEHEAASKAWDNYSGNNPNPPALKRMQAAGNSLARARDAAKAGGAIAYSESELLERELDRAFPEARSNEVVVHQDGRRFKRKFVPTGDKARPWDKYWEPVA